MPRTYVINELGERIVSDPWNPSPEEIAVQRATIKAENAARDNDAHTFDAKEYGRKYRLRQRKQQ